MDSDHLEVASVDKVSNLSQLRSATISMSYALVSVFDCVHSLLRFQPLIMKSQTLLSLFGVVALATVAYAHSGVEPRDFFWIVICETIMTAITAWGIGANDVANCFGTSVGSKSLTLWQAVIVASIFEFLGAFVLGSNVTDTVRKKIVEPCAFEKNPEFLMLGMFCADVATGLPRTVQCACKVLSGTRTWDFTTNPFSRTGLWLAVATYLRFPVSTTHSVIGAIIGFGLGAYGPSVVLWDKVGMVVLSWVTAPLSSCVAAAIIFFLVFSSSSTHVHTQL